MYKILSIFTGAGGLDLGFHGDFKFLDTEFKRLNFNTDVALDIDTSSCLTLNHNTKYFENTNVLEENILNFNKSKILNDYDVLLGGFPCGTFSMAGKRQGITDNINGNLYESYAEYVEFFKPKVFVAENVKGILSANSSEAIKIIKRRFEIAGYKLKIFLVNFANFGVPQLRERVIFIGIRDDIKTEFIPPEFTHLNNHITSSEAFKNLNTNCENHILTKQSISTTEKLKLIPEGGNFKDLPPQIIVKGIMSNIYRRLHSQKPAYTVLAIGGGGSYTYHYNESRAVTNRERARLQGFPDDFKFKGTSTNIRKQIGNAVPPAGIYHFAERIQNVLDGITPNKTPNCITEQSIKIQLKLL